MVASETGSGKTASYAMPILQLCSEYYDKQDEPLQKKELQFQISTNAKTPQVIRILDKIVDHC
jgi:superfamily II DNA/RNA helicase